MHNSRVFNHTFELLFRHNVGVDANAIPPVDETELLEALALVLLVVVAFLTEKFVAIVVDGQSNMEAQLMHCVSLYCA